MDIVLLEVIFRVKARLSKEADENDFQGDGLKKANSVRKIRKKKETPNIESLTGDRVLKRLLANLKFFDAENFLSRKNETHISKSSRDLLWKTSF